MKDLMNEIATLTPKLMEHTHLSLTLSDAPAAVAVGLVCVSGVAIYGLYCWEKLEERKVGIIESKKKREPHEADRKVESDISEHACVISLEQTAAS